MKNVYHRFVYENTTLVAIFLFLVIFGFMQWMKPAFLYNTDGSIRGFGIGYKNKTILPIWLISILLGILCYLFVLYCLVYPRLMF